jgi:hypothetical protein
MSSARPEDNQRGQAERSQIGNYALSAPSASVPDGVICKRFSTPPSASEVQEPSIQVAGPATSKASLMLGELVDVVLDGVSCPSLLSFTRISIDEDRSVAAEAVYEHTGLQVLCRVVEENPPIGELSLPRKDQLKPPLFFDLHELRLGPAAGLPKLRHSTTIQIVADRDGVRLWSRPTRQVRILAGLRHNGVVIQVRYERGGHIVEVGTSPHGDRLVVSDTAHPDRGACRAWEPRMPLNRHH